jgi:hypothetical protein
VLLESTGKDFEHYDWSRIQQPGKIFELDRLEKSTRLLGLSALLLDLEDDLRLRWPRNLPGPVCFLRVLARTLNTTIGAASNSQGSG